MTKIRKRQARQRAQERILGYKQAVRRGRKRDRNARAVWSAPRAIHDLLDHDIEIHPHEYCILASNCRLHAPHGLPVDGQLVEVPAHVFRQLPIHTDLPRHILYKTDLKRYPTRVDISTITPVLVPRAGTKYVLVNPESIKQRWPCIPNTTLQVFVANPKMKWRPDHIDVLRYAVVDAICLDQIRQKTAKFALGALHREYDDGEIFRRLFAISQRRRTNQTLENVAKSYVRLFECRSRSVRSRTRKPKK